MEGVEGEKWKYRGVGGEIDGGGKIEGERVGGREVQADIDAGRERERD